MGALPRGVVLAAAAAAGNAAYDVAGSKADLVRENMAIALGVPLDDPRVRRAARAAFQNYGRYLAEVMRLPATDPAVVEAERVTFVGWEDLAAARTQSSSGVIFCTVHVGAMDAIAPALAHRGERMWVVADDTTYGRLYDHLAAVRERHQIHLIGWRNLRAIYRVLREGGNLVLFCDGAYRPGDVPVEFLGRPTTLPAGPALLSAKTGAVLLPIHARRGTDGRLVARGFPIVQAQGTEPAEVYRVTQEVANSLGSVIAEDPGQWYMFRAVWPRTATEQTEAATALDRARRGEDWSA